MSSNKLSLIVNFQGIDKMSGALRNIVGLGNKGSKSIRALTGESKKLQAQVNAISKKTKAAGYNVTGLAEREENLRAKLAQVNTQLARQQRLAAINADRMAMLRKAEDYKSKGQSNLMGAAAMAAPLVFATKQAMDFEASMADVRKVVNFPTPQAFAKMSDDVLNLSTQIPMAADGIAAIVAAAGRANIPRKELLRFAGDAAKMGVAFDMSGDEAGNMMAKWRTAFGMGQSDVVRLSDQVNALTNAYGGNAPAVAGIVTRVGSLGKVSGVAAAQVGAMAQLLNSVGVEEEVAATGIKNMMLAMTKGKAATASQSQAFKLLGLDATQLSQRMQKDAGGAITDLLGRLAKVPKSQQAGILTQIFGSESVSAIAPMLTNLDKLKTNFALVGDKAQYAGSMQKEYLSAIATTQGASGLALNALKALNIKLGQEMLPTVTSLSRSIVQNANAVRAWTKQHPQLTSAIVKGVAALATFRILLGTTQLAFGFLLGPFANALALFRKVDGVSKFGTALTRVKGTLGLLKAAATTSFGGIRKGVVWLRAAGAQALMAGKRFIVAGARYTIMAARFVAGRAVALAGILANVGRAALTMGWGFARAGALMLANPIVLIIIGIAAALGVAAYLIYTHWDKISAAFATGVTWVKDKLSGLSTWMKSIGRMMMEGLLLAINPLALGAKLIHMAKFGIKAFKDYLGIKSPSRVFMALGGHVAGGLERGIDQNRHGPARAVRRMAAGAAAAGALSLTPMQAAARPGAASEAQAGGDTYHITIKQQPGEDTEALAKRLMEMIERKKSIKDRSSFNDH